MLSLIVELSENSDELLYFSNLLMDETDPVFQKRLQELRNFNRKIKR